MSNQSLDQISKRFERLEHERNARQHFVQEFILARASGAHPGSINALVSVEDAYAAWDMFKATEKARAPQDAQ